MGGWGVGGILFDGLDGHLFITLAGVWGGGVGWGVFT